LFTGTPFWEHGVEDAIPVLVARSVRTETGVEMVQTPAASGSFQAVETGRAQGGANVEVVTRLNTILRHQNAVSLAGSPIRLGPVRVQRVLDPAYLAVGQDIQHSILVHLPQPTQSIIDGDLVNIAGVIERSPESRQDRGLSLLLPVYIQATQVELLQR
jgi:hypothetical protein